MLLPLLLLACLSAQAHAIPFSGDEAVLIFRFEQIGQADTAFQGIHQTIRKKMELDNQFQNFKVLCTDESLVSLRVLEKRAGAVPSIAVGGSIGPGPDGSGKTGRFTIIENVQHIEETKEVLFDNVNAGDIADIVVLKLKNYLESNVLGKINITSTPLECDILVDSVWIGKTPKETILRTGNYDLLLQRKYLAPFNRKIVVLPGRSVEVNTEMEFNGYHTEYWLLGSLVGTWQCAVALVLEQRLRKEAGNALEGPDYNRYENASYIRITIMNLAILGWIGTGFCYFSNRMHKYALFHENSLNQTSTSNN